ncbi:CC175 protein, partial [Polypterus senegalus]|nr:CC175 protein [Polypterus senegalus]
MTSCIVPDFPAVLVALEHLHEIENQLQLERVGLSDDASQSFAQIAAAIEELERSRRSVREELEVETIETSKLRHGLQSQPSIIKAELADALAAVRDSNAAQLNQLKLDLQRVTEEVDIAEKSLRFLAKHNSSLFPEREQVRAEHEGVIEQLNNHLTEKANKRIVVNEIYIKIRDTEKHTARLRKALENLEKAMMEERKRFGESKDALGIKCVKILEKSISLLKSSRSNQNEELSNAQRKMQDLLKQKVNIEKHKRNLEELNEQLRTERQARLSLQAKHDEINTELDRLKEGHLAYMKEKEREILLNRNQHAELSKEHDALQIANMNLYEEIEALSQQHSKAEEAYRLMEQSLTADVQELEEYSESDQAILDEIYKLLKQIEQRQKKIGGINVKFQDELSGIASVFGHQTALPRNTTM